MDEIIAIFNDASKGQDSLATSSFARRKRAWKHIGSQARLVIWQL